MLTASGEFYPQWDSNYNHVKYEPELLPRKTNSIADHWIPTADELYKKGPFTFRNEFADISTNTARLHNDENAGLVFGCTQQCSDTKQYDWVWRWVNDTNHR